MCLCPFAFIIFCFIFITINVFVVAGCVSRLIFSLVLNNNYHRRKQMLTDGRKRLMQSGGGGRARSQINENMICRNSSNIFTCMISTLLGKSRSASAPPPTPFVDGGGPTSIRLPFCKQCR